MRRSFLPTLAFCFFFVARTAIAELPPETPLWPADFKNTIAYDRDEAVRTNDVKSSAPSKSNRVFSFVSKATYTIHQADIDKATGVGLVICPGGGYVDVWLDREGHDWAIVLQKHGITSLVLKYRTNSSSDGNRVHEWDDYLPEVEADARRGIKVLREQADSLKIDPKKIGICGFSAGGNLAILATIQKPKDGDALGVPNFAGLFYPWLRDDYTKAIEANDSIPPLFIMNAVDDRVTPTNKSIDFYAQLLKAKVKAELHVYNQGGHGFDLGVGRGDSTAMWPKSFVAWLKDQGF